MAFAIHNRVSCIGYLGAPNQEMFSYGFNIGVTQNVIPSQGPEILQDIVDDITAFHGRANTHISNGAVLTMVKFAQIGADGKYTKDPVIFTVNQAGGVTSNQAFTLPQSALAISLGTARRGPTGRGRFYIPLPVLDVDAADGFRFNPNVALAIRDSAATLLNDVNNAPGIDYFGTEPEVVIASSKGYNTRVTTVRVGRIVDTIRSRRNQLAEIYTPDAAIS